MHTYILKVSKQMNIKIEEISIQDLVKEALSIPNGWKEEIFVEDGEVSFSGPETHNTYTAIDPHEPLAIADLKSMSIGDFEGFYLREDGKVEIADYTGQFKEKGEYYEHAEIVEYDEAVERIAFNLENTQSTLNDLLKTIKQSQEKMKCQNCL